MNIEQVSLEASAALVGVCLPSVVPARDTIALTSWTKHGPAGAGTWNVSTDGLSVLQTINGSPTYFVSDFDLTDSRFEGTFRVEPGAGDDDYIGFVFAFNGLASDQSFYLVTWKQLDQATGEGFGEEGLKLFKVKGDVTSGEIWNGETPSRRTVLASLPGTARGWAHGRNYRFEGGENLISQAVTVTQTAAAAFRVSGLAPLTGNPGSYELTVDATGVQDLLGGTGVGFRAVAWQPDATAPTLVRIAQRGGTAVTFPVRALTLHFSEPIDPATFTPEDLTLTRNGGPDLVADGISIRRLLPAAFSITGLEAFTENDGVYVLDSNRAGIANRAGNSVQGDGRATWTMDSAGPEPPRDLALTPDTGISSIDGITNARQVTLSGTLPEPGMSVFVQDERSGVPLGRANVPGTSFSYVLGSEESGARRIKLRTFDAAGNSASSQFEFFIDVQAPSVAGFHWDPVAQQYRVVEDGEPLSPGYGVWGLATEQTEHDVGEDAVPPAASGTSGAGDEAP